MKLADLKPGMKVEVRSFRLLFLCTVFMLAVTACVTLCVWVFVGGQTRRQKLF